MKKVMIIAMVIVVMSISACGTYENESAFGSLSQNLVLQKGKVLKSAKQRIPGVNVNVLKNVEISFADNEDYLFSDMSKSEFSTSAIDVYIGAKFIGYNGVHNVGIRVYLPDGSLYTSKSAGVDFDKGSSFAANGLIFDFADGVLIVKDILPVAGSEISVFNLVGKYSVEVVVDNIVVSSSYFTIK